MTRRIVALLESESEPDRRLVVTALAVRYEIEGETVADVKRILLRGGQVIGISVRRLAELAVEEIARLKQEVADLRRARAAISGP